MKVFLTMILLTVGTCSFGQVNYRDTTLQKIDARKRLNEKVFEAKRDSIIALLKQLLANTPDHLPLPPAHQLKPTRKKVKR